MLKSLLIKILLKLLALTPADASKSTLTKEVEDGMLSQMWESPAFRKRVAERDAKLIYTMAGGEGMKAEDRVSYLMHTGQRVENLLLARDAKAAHERWKRQRSTLAQAQEPS
jgi:hypothetical protein